MKALDFLEKLRGSDIQVWAEGDRLRCNAPAGALTAELRNELQLRKNEILKFLRSAEALAQQQRAIVPLQPRGTGVPVFAVAGHNGDVFCFRAIAHHLGADQPFFGLQPPGLDGNHEPLTRVEDLAAFFAAQIRKVRPDGPYIIAGYCAGGTIAFELARQLIRDGAPVRALALFGSPFPTSYRRLPQLRLLCSQVIGQVVRHTRAFFSLSTVELRAYIAERLRNIKTERAARHTAAADPVMEWRAKVGNATLAAIRRYVPGSYAGRLALFWPCQQCTGNALTQWPSLAQRTEKYFGPDGCDGATMLREPYAATFAGLFRQCAGKPTPNNGAMDLPQLDSRRFPRLEDNKMSLTKTFKPQMNGEGKAVEPSRAI
jgi:thioesterase domain-containing protein